MDKTEENKGEELSQLSRLLFDKAASFWYQALVIELLAGTMGITLSLFTLSNDLKLLFGICGFLLLLTAYIRKLQFEDIYENAETMRRQSILTEALGWSISKTQFSQWRQKAGKEILQRFKLRSRDKNYYDTQRPQGPTRLLEMTMESAFWTRHLYGKIKKYAWIIFLIIAVLSVVAISVVPFSIVPQANGLKIVYSVYLLLPLILSINLFGWAKRLGKLEHSIYEIERDLETLSRSDIVTTELVMRLVSEYNCQVTSGFPIPNKMFNWWHDEITQLWKQR